MTQYLLILTIIESIVIAFMVGMWTGRRLERKSKSVAPTIQPTQNVDNMLTTPPQILKDTPLDNIEIPKEAPRSVVSKFPNPQDVKKRKDMEQTQAYLDDMRQEARPAGSFVV